MRPNILQSKVGVNKKLKKMPMKLARMMKKMGKL